MKRVKVRQGQVFAVPLRDGMVGLGQVVSVNHRGVACALFPKKARTHDELLENVDETLKSPLTILVITGVYIRTGHYAVITDKEVDYSEFAVPTDGKGASHTDDMLEEFLQAYFGLDPWDGMYRPDYFERKLIPGRPVPPTVRYKRDFPPPGGEAPAAPSEAHASVIEGPAEIHIQILYPGNDLPTPDQLHRRQELERRLEAEGAGEVTDAGGGEGIMDVYLETDDVKRAMPIVEHIVSELDLAADTLIETGPFEADDDEEDENGDESE